jgi:hypothetical protein
MAQFWRVELGRKARFIPYVVVLGTAATTDSFVLSKIVFVENGDLAISAEDRGWRTWWQLAIS